MYWCCCTVTEMLLVDWVRMDWDYWWTVVIGGLTLLYCHWEVIVGQWTHLHSPQRRSTQESLHNEDTAYYAQKRPSSTWPGCIALLQWSPAPRASADLDGGRLCPPRVHRCEDGTLDKRSTRNKIIIIKWETIPHVLYNTWLVAILYWSNNKLSS